MADGSQFVVVLQAYQDIRAQGFDLEAYQYAPPATDQAWGVDDHELSLGRFNQLPGAGGNVPWG
jgi:hypothetical protein